MNGPMVRLLTLDPLSRLLMLGLALDPPGPVPAPGDWNGLRGVSLRPPQPAPGYARAMRNHPGRSRPAQPVTEGHAKSDRVP